MAWLMVAAFLVAQAGDQAQLLDRIAVTVGKTVITEGEVLTNLRVAAFLDQKEPDLSGPSKKAGGEPAGGSSTAPQRGSSQRNH